MSFRENYKKEMQEIKHDEALDQTILDAVKDNSIELGGVESGYTKSTAWGQVSERGRWTGRWAAVIIAMICGIMLVVNFPSVVSYADAVIGNFRLIAGGSQMQLSEMTPVEIDLEKHIAYEKTELLDAPDQMSYWCTYETQDLLQENTGLLISKSDALNVQNVVVSIDTMYRTGHLSMKVVWNGKKYGMNGMFVIDEETAPVVKQIFALCLAGNGPTKIARMLSEQNIPTPGTMEYRRTGSTRRYYPDYPCRWSPNTVGHILERKEYLGHTVNFKTEKVSYKVKTSVLTPEKEQVFENTHEPIIDLPTWERVQELRQQRKRPNRFDEVGLFSGLVFCADCGSVMYQQRYDNDRRKQDCYICGSYKKRTADCTAHFIRTDLLKAGVTANLKAITSYASKHEAKFVKQLLAQNEDGGKKRTAARKRELDAAEKRMAELKAIFKRLYEDSVSGRITDERFEEMSADYEQEQTALKERNHRHVHHIVVQVVGAVDEHDERLAVVALLEGIDAFHRLDVGGVTADAPHRVGGVEDESAVTQHLEALGDIGFHLRLGFLYFFFF